MATINQVKEQPQSDTPILFFDCLLPSTDLELWCTHTVIVEGQVYSARVLGHNLFELQLSGDDAMDSISQLSITLANADSALSELNSAIGFKGSQLTVYFGFVDLRSGQLTTERTVLFRGIASDPEEITESTFSVSFINKLSLQRIPVPDVRIQRSCAWNFPSTVGQRTEARDGVVDGRVSRYYRCGYSPDLLGGVGNLVGGEVFVSCDKSRAQCEARGMFNKDVSGNSTGRFGGFEFVPSTITVRTAGDKTTHVSALLSNAAKYNDPVPLVFGTGWLKAPIVFCRNDGNLTHMEVVLGLGSVSGFLKVVVNDVEIPQAIVGQDMTATGWYSLIGTGARNGSFNLDFSDASGNPLGDPHGSMASASVVVPNRISTGTSLPVVEILLRGVQIDTYDVRGQNKLTCYSNNPAWVILDLLNRSGWPVGEVSLPSFGSAATYCAELINTSDLNGNQIQVPRFECNLILTKRQSAATLIRGIRVAASLMLRYGVTGLLELLPETAIADQQPTLPDGSNSVQDLEGGWPAHEFGDGSNSFSGVLRNADGSSSVRLSARSIAETSNRLSVEFQDATNEYQQDSLSLVDSDDSELIGYEISSQSTALGITNFSQATRVLLRQIDKLTKGNLYVQFQTSFRALKIRPGDLITLTYLKEGFQRVPFRVVKLSPADNYQTVEVLAQIHSDDWYSDNPSVLGGAGRQPSSQVATPRPLIGTVERLDGNGNFELFDFGVAEQIQAYQDGTATDRITVSYSQPSKPSANATGIPLLTLSPAFDVTQGKLGGGQTFYYGVSSVGSDGREGPLSFTVPANIPSGTNTNSVTLQNLSLPSSANSFYVYRGISPQSLYRIGSGLSAANSFTDPGAQDLPVGPPDQSFDHANFFYRYEYAGPFKATKADSSSISSNDMGATPSAYSSMTVRIIDGTGDGQERQVTGNDRATLLLTNSWSTIPDNTSVFVICESSWHFAAVSTTSPVQFEIPYRAGGVIQISGRAANVHNQESAPELSPVTRLALGQEKSDAGVPTMPSFFLDAPGAGIVTLSQVGFSDLTNVASVSSGTLRLFYWNELNTPSPVALATAMDQNQTELVLNSSTTCTVGDVIQIGTELMIVSATDTSSQNLTVVRGSLGSTTSSHSITDTVFALNTSVVTTAFAASFFENRSSVDFIHPFQLPDVRISASEFFVTNSFGDSQAQFQCYTANPAGGIRTLSGGQYSLQSYGYVVTQVNACPAVTIDKTHAVRDVHAFLAQPTAGYQVQVDILQNGTQYCQVVLNTGEDVSNVLSGVALPPITEGAVLTVNLTLLPVSSFSGTATPGKDLSIAVRL